MWPERKLEGGDAQKLLHTQGLLHREVFTQRSSLHNNRPSRGRGCPPATWSTPGPWLWLPPPPRPGGMAARGPGSCRLESKAIGASAVLVYPAPRWRCCEERRFSSLSGPWHVNSNFGGCTKSKNTFVNRSQLDWGWQRRKSIESECFSVFSLSIPLDRHILGAFVLQSWQSWVKKLMSF